MKCILMDIEGTISSIDFVHKVLFPYSRANLREFIQENGTTPEVRSILQRLWLEDLGRPETSELDYATIDDQLQKWIVKDLKHPLLKALQGKVWRQGYESKAYRSHIYPDVPPNLKIWQNCGLELAVYSSGSVEAQDLLFKYTEYGDLRRAFSAFFDTAVGSKRESSSYLRIVETLKGPADQLLFLSDIAEELDAAAAAGMKTCQILREGTEPSPRHSHARTFDDVTRIYVNPAING